MPIIQVTMTHEDGGATKEQKEQLSQKLTTAFDEVFGRGAKTAVVVINEVSTDNYAMGGKTITHIRNEQKA